MQFDTDEYEEHVLISTGNGIAAMPHHIMKFTAPKFDIESLMKPVKLVRQADLNKEEEQDTRPTIVKSKKSKAFFLGREEQDIVLGGGDITQGTLIAPIGSRLSDPDKSPWILSDASNQKFVGNVEGSQSSAYVLFVNAGHGFKVIPVQKWYKFNKKIETKITSLDEAEEKMNKMNKDRWVARDATTTKKSKNSLKDKLMIKEELGDVVPKKQKNLDLEDVGMDFEHQMSDDEDINFGLEDEDEAREAHKRVFTKGVAENDLDEEKKWSVLEKKIAKSLLKRENADVYDDYGPENPYWTDEEEEEVKPEPITNPLLEKVKKKGKDSPKPEKQKLPADEQPAKKQKLDTSMSPVPASKTTPPPPPTAAEVVARELEKEKKRKRSGSRGPSPSPAPSISSVPKTPPTITTTDDNDSTLMNEDDLVRVIKKRGGLVTVKDIVSDLKPFFVKDAEKNKQRMRVLMKQCLVQENKKFKLKSGYENWVDPKQ